MTDVPPSRAMWEQRFGGEDYYYGTEPNEYLRDHISSLPVGEVLCVAEGEGRNAVFLAQRGWQVHSVDLTESGVAKTLQLADRQGVRVDAAVGDLEVFDIGADRWDAIVSIFAHMPAAVRRSLHARVVTALRPGGVLLLEAYTPAQVGRGTGGPQVVEMTMTLDGLRTELAGLEVVHGVELDRDIIEGGGHSGIGSVVQVIARKPS